MRNRVEFPEVNFGGNMLVVVQYLSDDLITLVEKKDARKLYRAGTVGILTPDDWLRIQADNKGEGLNVDQAFLR